MNTVKAIKDPAKLLAIQETMEQYTDRHGERMYLLFEVGIYTGLRISDLVRLRVKNVSGAYIEMIEKKTGKRTRLLIAQGLRDVIQDRTRGMDKNALLFPSRVRNKDGTEKPITTRTAYADMRIIAQRFNLGSDIGCHTLRKTFGYWHYKKEKDLELLRRWFNHSDAEITRRYICVAEEEMQKSMQGFRPGGYTYHPRGTIKHGRPAVESEPMDIKRLDRTKQAEARNTKRRAKSGGKRKSAAKKSE